MSFGRHLFANRRKQALQPAVSRMLPILPFEPPAMKTTPLFLLLALAVSTLRAGTDAPPDFPVPVASFGAAALADGSLFIYGGHSGKRHKYNRDEVSGSLHRWQPGATTWEALAKDEPAQGASLVASKDGIIRVGGMAARNAPGDEQDLWSSETASLYTPAQSSWTALPKLPQRRSSHDSIVSGHTLYVIGGWRLEGDADAVWHDTYLTLDLSQPGATWQSHPQPFKRRALAVQAIDGKVYAIGGMNDDNKTVSDVAVLDAATGQWSDGPKLPADKIGGFGFAAVAHDGRLFASGLNGTLLELRRDQWLPVAKLAHPRYFHRLLPAGPGKLVAIGGENREGAKPAPEIIPIPAPDSPPLPPEPAAAKPAAKS